MPHKPIKLIYFLFLLSSAPCKQQKLSSIAINFPKPRSLLYLRSQKYFLKFVIFQRILKIKEINILTIILTCSRDGSTSIILILLSTGKIQWFDKVWKIISQQHNSMDTDIWNHWKLLSQNLYNNLNNALEGVRKPYNF